MKFFKKLMAFLKWAIVGVIWSYFYLLMTMILFKSVWGFNYMSRRSWNVISTFWEQGGRIKSGNDYLFVICLLLLIPLWIWGWKKLYKTNYVALLLIPVLWYQNRSAKKYMKSMSRIKIHNIGISIGDDVKQDFEDKLKRQQTEIEKSPKASQAIRSGVKNRLKKQS